MVTKRSLIDIEQGDFDLTVSRFRWSIPEQFNIAEATCARHADGTGKPALIAEASNGEITRYSFDEIDAYRNKLATVLRQHGLNTGERVAVILPQRVETALVHLAAHTLAAISLPLSVLFGDEALLYRLQDSGSKLVVCTASKAKQLISLQAKLPDLKTILIVEDDDTRNLPADMVVPNVISFWQAINQSSGEIEITKTNANAPAFLLYTSGTTGPPKGALIAHRSLIGNLTGFELSHDGFPQTNDCMYTPADWAWTGGLLDGLLPAWYYGVPVVAYENKKFDSSAILSLMSRHKVTCAFIPPTALKMIRSHDHLLLEYPLSLRSVMSAGESVGEELFSWGREKLGLDINEMCGQTEHNYLMGNCAKIMDIKPGSMGKAYPGHRVAIMAADGSLQGPDTPGELVAHKDDPVHFLGYWNNPAATAAKYTGDWFHTGDVAYQDKDGYLWFMGRADDVISSAGYRIGPGEIEDCVMKHPSVLQVAAIGVPDPEGIRGDVVKLCIVLRQGFDANDALVSELQTQVRNQLAAYEYPRVIEFYDALPMTTTGKVKRGELRKLADFAVAK